MSGFSQNELFQHSCLCTMMHGELTSTPSVDRLRNALQTQTEDQIDILLYKKNKTPIWFLVQITPVRSHSDVIILFLLLFRNVTPLKQTIIEQNGKASGLSKFAWLARTMSRNKTPLPQSNGNAANGDTPVLPVSNNHVKPSLNQVQPMDTGPPFSSSINLMAFDQTEAVPFYRQEAPKTPPHIILHYSSFKSHWNWVILAMTFYTAILVPYNASFQAKTSNFRSVVVLDGVVDVVFLVDVFINFHSTFVGSAGEIVSDPRVIRANYFKTWFIVDLLCCLPYDLINYAVQHPSSDELSAVKVIRLLRLTRVGRKLHLYLEYGAAVLTLLLIMFLIISHWFACIWFTIGETEAHNGITYGWLQTLGQDIQQPFKLTNTSTGELVWEGGPTSSNAYVTALYFSMSCMTSVGFGNVSASTQSEKIFSIFMMVFGALLYATIFGNVTTIFQQMYSTTQRYHDMLSSIKEFMKTHQVPVSLGERVIDYVVSNWAVTKGIDDSKVLNNCPKDMKGDLCFHLNRTVFAENPAFRLASNGCLRELALYFTRVHCAPGEIVFHQGESLDTLCFIVSGSIEIVQDDEVVSLLSKGDVFGDKFSKEIPPGQSAANVRALTYCDLHCIKRDHLLHVLELYQSFANSFVRNLTLSYNLRQRLVFRKLADVEREKELANRTKHDTPLDASTDLTVRRLLSRFRKTGPAGPGSGENSLQQRRTTSSSSLPRQATLPNNNNNDPSSHDLTTADVIATSPPVPNGSIDGGVVVQSVKQNATSAPKMSKLGQLFRNSNITNVEPAVATAPSTPAALPTPLSPVVISVTSPSPSTAAKPKAFGWSKLKSPSSTESKPPQTSSDNQTHADVVVTVHNQHQQPPLKPSQRANDSPSVQGAGVHQPSRCQCSAESDVVGNRSSFDVRIELDRLNGRIDRLDQNVATILRLLTTGSGHSAEVGNASTPKTGGLLKPSSAGSHFQQHDGNREAAVVDTGGGDFKRSSSPQSPTSQRMEMSPAPLLMDTIREQEEETGVQHSISDVILSAGHVVQVASASVEDEGSESSNSSASSTGFGVTKRFMIQHDMEIV